MPTSTEEELRLGYLIHDVSRLRRTLFDKWLSPLGITRSQWWVLAFLSRKEDEHHQVVFASGRGPDVPTILNQISFLVEDLETLQAFYQALKAEGVTGFDPINHGNAWSVYFPDPEGNRIELYCVTPWHVQQPFAEKFDLDAPLEEIRAKTLALIRDRVPSHLVVDGDTGYGNALNVQRTLVDYARAGAACVMIEDQVSPKKCGHTRGKQVVSRAEARMKIRAAVDARANADILVMARTDACARP